MARHKLLGCRIFEKHAYAKPCIRVQKSGGPKVLLPVARPMNLRASWPEGTGDIILQATDADLGSPG